MKTNFELFFLIRFLLTASVFSTNDVSISIPTCEIKCPSKQPPRPNPNHEKSADGCGSKGLHIDENRLPKREMEQCCNEHDFCYDTCNSGKSNCDDVFKKCLLNVCDDSEGAKGIFCKGTAELFYNIVKDVGCPSYYDAQKDACLC